MKIFLKNIPENTNRKQINSFLDQSYGLFRQRGHIANITFLFQQGNHRFDHKFHALVTITPESIAEKSIKSLNRKQLNGKYINVLEYKPRLCLNDKRCNRGDDQVNCKRLCCRRQNKLIVLENCEWDEGV